MPLDDADTADGKNKDYNDTKIVKDSSYGWLICLGSFLVYFICFGILNCFGVLLGPIAKEYGASNAATGWVGSLAFGVHFASSTITAALYDSIGIRATTAIGIFLSCSSLLGSSYAPSINVLYFSYGVGLGVGTSLISLPAVIILRVYFEKRLSLANGVVASGSVLGTLSFSPALTAVTEYVGLRWTLRTLALISLGLSVLLCLHKPSQSPIGRKRINLIKILVGQFSNKVLRTNMQFKLFICAICVFLTGHLIPLIYLVDIAEHLGATPLKASLVMCYTSIVSAIGRIFFGALLSSFKLSVMKVFLLALLSMGTSHLFVPLIRSFTWLCVYASFFGFFEGCFVSQFPVVVNSLVGEQYAATALGITYTIMAIPMVSGPPLAGRIFDLTKSYNIAFFIAGTASVLGGLLFSGVVCMSRNVGVTSNDELLLPTKPNQNFFSRSVVYKKGSLIINNDEVPT